MDDNTKAYTNIKWKTSKEKQTGANVKKDNTTALVSRNGNSSLLMFLESECIKTDFEYDYILVSDLKTRYDKFCETNQIEGPQKVNVYGSMELEDFGSNLNQNMMVPYINGITFSVLLQPHSEDYLHGIVRVPTSSKSNNFLVRAYKTVSSTIKSIIFSETGIIANLMIVLSHVIMLLLVPLPIMIALIWSLLQIDIINEDIYAPTYTLNNVFNPSQYEFWISHLPAPGIFWVLFVFMIIFWIFGLIELISFYATDAKDNGKYPVKYTLVKWISVVCFWAMFLFFLSLYAAYISVILAWCMLGAIISPEKFLPVATGAGVLIVFTYTLYTRLKKVSENLEEAIGKIVEEEIGGIISNTFGKKGQNLSENIQSTAKEIAAKGLQSALNVLLQKFDMPSVTQEMAAAILEGDMSGILDVLHECCGIDPNISLALIGFLKEDSDLIMESVNGLARELDLDVDLSITLCEIIVEKFNPYSLRTKKIDGKLVITAKKLFRAIFPNFPLDTAEKVLKLVCDGDLNELEFVYEALNIPKIVPAMIKLVATQDCKNLETIVEKFCDDHIQDPFKGIYKGLNCIYKGAQGNDYKYLAD